MELGGPPILVLDILQHLDKERFESTIATGITIDRKYDMIGFARDKNIRVFAMPSLVRDIHPLKDIKTLIKLAIFQKETLILFTVTRQKVDSLDVLPLSWQEQK